MTWTSFIEEAPAAEHAVQIYDRLDELAASVGRFLEAGFRVGEPAIVIATDDHRRVFARELERRGWDAAALQDEGLLVCCDAEETLAAFFDGTRASSVDFEREVGGLVDEIEARYPGKTIRAFGEMVDLLWQRGHAQAALALEELWNELAQTRRFALLCGYRLDIFDLDVQASALPEIFGAHSHGRPAFDTSLLAAAVDAALGEVVGSREAGTIYLRVADEVPRASLPRAEAVLLWLTQHRRPVARQVLDRVRLLYGQTETAPTTR
jgi:hypothetical protein